MRGEIQDAFDLMSIAERFFKAAELIKRKNRS